MPSSVNDHSDAHPNSSNRFSHDDSQQLASSLSTTDTTRDGREVQPRLLRDPSLFSTFRNAWSTPTDSRVMEQKYDEQQPGETRDQVGQGDFGRRGEESALVAEAVDGAYGEAEDGKVNGRRYETGRMKKDGVAWAKWESIEREDGSARRLLIQGYASGAFAVWDCSNLDNWLEVLNLRSLESTLSRKDTTHRPSLKVGKLVDATVIPCTGDPTTIAILTRSSSSSHIFLYSLIHHEITSDFKVAGVPHHIAANQRFLVVSTTSPLALHVVSTTSLKPTSFSPITDLVPSPFDESPVFSLGSGGRLLAYATDHAIPTSRLDRSPAKPGAGLLAHAGLFDSDVGSSSSSSNDESRSHDPLRRSLGARDGLSRGSGAGQERNFMNEAGQVGGEVARRVGEGVLSGVKMIGEAGMTYWMTRNGQGRSSSGDGGEWSTFSKSAPATTIAGFGRRLSVPSAFTMSSSTPLEADPSHSSAAGTVAVVDLVASSRPSPRPTRSSRSPSSTNSKLKKVAHFRPYSHPIASLSLSPSSTSLLTASSLSHSFDIFELHPSVPIGLSALQAVPSSVDSSSGKVWHRYRLQRGYTTARTVSATWSNDSKCVAVGTGKGTFHLYAVQPAGGQPDFETHFNPKVHNLADLPPLSVSLSTIARVRVPSTSHTVDAGAGAAGSAFPSLAFVSKSDTFASSFQPDSRPKRQFLSTLAPLQDLLIFDPSSCTAQLHRLSPVEVLSPSSSPSAAVAAARNGEVGKLATTAVSGLTQLMKSKGGFGTTSSVASSSGGSHTKEKRQWTVTCAPKAEWDLASTTLQVHRDVVENVGGGLTQASRETTQRMRYSASAEIETFSRSPRVLPRSVYQSQQFAFFSLPSDFSTLTSQGSYTFANLRRLEMRSEVLVRQGVSAVTTDRSSSPFMSPSDDYSAPFEPASFDQPIKTAMQTVLDHDAILASGSPKPAPSFPVGIAAKQGSWRDSIPIRAVGPAAMESIGKVRQGLGRVRLPNASELVNVARRRSSAASPVPNLPGPSSPQVAYSSSISFDDDEAVFADRNAIEDGASTGTACTSEIEDEQHKGLDEVDEWGWDEEPSRPATRVKSSVSIPDITLATIPFEEDFDDFELDLSPPAPPSRTTPLDSDLVLASTPIIQEPVSATLSPSLASTPSIPIAMKPSLVYETNSSGPSPGRPVNPLLEAIRPTISTPSSSPSSVSSSRSSSSAGGKKKKKK